MYLEYLIVDSNLYGIIILFAPPLDNYKVK